MADPGFLKAHPEGSCLSIKVAPRSSRNEIGSVTGEELKLKVTAPPVDSAANEAVLRLLAEQLACPRSSIQLVRGHTSRRKVILVRGMTPPAVLAKLSAG